MAVKSFVGDLGKVYRGFREGDGGATVLVGSKLLTPDASLKLINHSPTGFEWGYQGSGPAQLALGILLDYMGDQEAVLKLYQKFKFRVVSQFPRAKCWTLTGQEVQAHLDAIEQEDRMVHAASNAAEGRHPRYCETCGDYLGQMTLEAFRQAGRRCARHVA